MAKKLFFFSRLSALIFIFSLSFKAWGAKVTKMKRSRGFIMVDGGKVEGFKRNEEVCFFNFLQINVGCGTVYKISREKSLVQVPLKTAKKIKKGFFARNQKMEAQRKRSDNAVYNFSPKLVAYYSILPSFSYNNLVGLESPNVAESTLFLQRDKGPSGFSFYSGLELDIHMIGLTLGFNMMVLPPASQLINDTGSDKNTQTTYAYSNRFFLDYTFYPHHMFGIGLGVQGTLQGISVDLMADSVTDGDSSFGKIRYNEQHLTLAARLPLSLNFVFKPVGFFLKVTPIVSFYNMSLGNSLTPDKETRAGGEHPFKTQLETLEKVESYSLEEDIKNQLAFQHQIFSLDVAIGFLFAF